ncbi:hypothetical protein DPMN_027080 [Dreissena polymorpha]|uniref:Uncharacterized protein n=1 Tax=Dreissena polymorpha TaxID=45954 RepID=A0A9D4LS82_DREPO|nr:hypothetical protein DPMN_027080 [Dreissena polymorpha]
MDDGDWCLDKEHKSQKYIKRLESAFNKRPVNTDAATASIDSTVSLDVLHVEENLDADLSEKQFQTEPVQSRNTVEHHEKDDFVQMFSPLVEKMQNETNKKPSEDTKVSLEKTLKEITVSVWDFVGQTLYYSTHQFFLNKRSIYLVLMDMTKPLDEDVKELDGSGIWCGLVYDCKYLIYLSFG